MAEPILHDATWERMIRAVEKVRERLRRATQALERAGVPHAVVGGHAVAAWVAKVDEAAVRNTKDVDLMLRRADLDAARSALEATGFVYRQGAGIDMFLDGDGTRDRDAVRVVFAGEKVRPEYALAAPDVDESEQTAAYRVLTLEALVRMELTLFHRENMVHVRDLIDVGLIDATWLERLPEPLGERLRELLEDPDG